MVFPCDKRTNTKIQIHKYTNTAYDKCQKDPACDIFLKRGLFKDIKNYIPMCRRHKYKNTSTKYTNTAYDKVPERPNMWYIFVKRIVQGYQKSYSHVSNAQMQNKVPERLNMWGIFEKAILQRYLLSFHSCTRSI